MWVQAKSGLETVCISFMTLSTIAIGLRFYTRKTQRLPLKADDVFALLGVITYLAAGACVLRMIHLKVIGYSRNDVPVSVLIPRMKMYTSLGSSYETALNLAVTFVKLSALFFYRRFFSIPGVTPVTDRVIIGTIVLVVVWILTFIPLTFLACGTHFSAYWNGQAAEDRYCKDAGRIYLALPLSNLLLESWILILPIPKIARLQTSLAKRLSVMGVFLLAFIGLGSSFARTIIDGEIVNGGDQYLINRDRGIASTTYAFLSMLEAGISLVAVNLPTLWYLCTTIISKGWFMSRHGSQAKQSGKASDVVRVRTNVQLGGFHSGAAEVPSKHLEFITSAQVESKTVV